jgi:hypothetical protein
MKVESFILIDFHFENARRKNMAGAIFPTGFALFPTSAIFPTHVIYYVFGFPNRIGRQGFPRRPSAAPA